MIKIPELPQQPNFTADKMIPGKVMVYKYIVELTIYPNGNVYRKSYPIGTGNVFKPKKKKVTEKKQLTLKGEQGVEEI